MPKRSTSLIVIIAALVAACSLGAAPASAALGRVAFSAGLPARPPTTRAAPAPPSLSRTGTRVLRHGRRVRVRVSATFRNLLAKTRIARSVVGYLR